MRRLKPSEVTLLVAGLTIGSGNLEATEQGVIATVTVTASRITINTVPQFTFPVGPVLPGQLPAASGTNTNALQAQHKHAVECAFAYGQGRIVPRDGYVTYFDANYGWGRLDRSVYTTTSNTTPPGTGWFLIDGFTTHTHPGAPFILGQTQIFLASHTTPGQLINTLAHEWAHQSRQTEETATRLGNDVEAAYKADAGRKCGGL
jgi:hypothetical protein